MWVASTVLALLTVATYVPSFGNGFVNYDDDIYVYRNKHVTVGLSPQTLEWALTSTHASNWHPLTWISHAAQWELFGPNPAGHHAVSILLHSVNAVLLFFLLFLATKQIGRSWAVAALWALHPLQVECVAWVAEQKSLISMMLFLCTLGAYGWYVRRPSPQRYAVVAAIYALALTAKPMVITLPAVLILLDFWPLRRITSAGHASGNQALQISIIRAVIEKIPLLLMSFGSAIITIVAQKQAIHSFETLPFGLRLENAVWSYVAYLGKILWPVNLSVLYLHPGFLPPWKPVLGLSIVVAITTAAWKLRRGHIYLMIGWLWFLGTLIPMIGLIQVGNQAMADRYMYLPMVGVLVAMVWFIGNLVERSQSTTKLVTVTLAAVLMVLSLLTWRQIRYWRSGVDLWRHTISVTTGNWLAEANLATELVRQGQMEEARQLYQHVLTLNPRNASAHANLGGMQLKDGKIDGAVQELEMALSSSPTAEEQSKAYQNLGVAYVQMGDPVRARNSYQQALHADPDSFHDAIENYQKTVATNPTGEGYLWLAILLGQSGQTGPARQAEQRAFELNPELSQARNLIDQLVTTP